MKDKIKKCPFCGEEIKVEAQKCRFCGKWIDEWLDVDETKEEPKTKKCFFCGEEIDNNSEKCEFCGENLNSKENNVKDNTKNNSSLLKQKLISLFLLVFCIVIISMFFLLFKSFDSQRSSYKNNSQESRSLTANQDTYKDNTQENQSLTDQISQNIDSISRNNISYLYLGCANDGEEVKFTADFGGNYHYLAMTTYYCKNKPWPKVVKYKDIQGKHYDYTVFADNDTFLGRYYWSRGDYYCYYSIDEDAYTCSPAEFIEKIEEKAIRTRTLQTAMKKKMNQIESLLVSNCRETFGGFYCENKNWTIVDKQVIEDEYLVRYHVYYKPEVKKHGTIDEVMEMNHLGSIIVKKDKVVCETDNGTIECSPEQFITIINNKFNNIKKSKTSEYDKMLDAFDSI